MRFSEGFFAAQLAATLLCSLATGNKFRQRDDSHFARHVFNKKDLATRERSQASRKSPDYCLMTQTLISWWTSAWSRIGIR